MKIDKHHVLYWGIYMVYTMTLDIINLGKQFRIEKEMVVFVIELWIFYSFYYTLKSYKRGRRYRVLRTALYFAASLIATFDLNQVRVLVGKHFGNVYFNTTTEFIINTIEFYTQFAMYSLVYFFAQRSFIKQKQLRILERKELETQKERLELKSNNIQLQQENLQLEKELLQSENNFLRAQINPHFLYNSLNFFFSETFERQPEVAEGILTLSQIMRYSLNDHKNSNGLAWLSEEIDHIRNVVKMHQMRFEDGLQIRLEVEGEYNHRQVAPMVLITLVENVFKHGDLHNADNPALLTCRIDPEKKMVCFTTSNMKKKSAGEPSTGVGLSNALQRLQTLYKENCSITTRETDADYTVELLMPYFDELQDTHIFKKASNYTA